MIDDKKVKEAAMHTVDGSVVTTKSLLLLIVSWKVLAGLSMNS
jgi:hypothetical protein